MLTKKEHVLIGLLVNGEVIQCATIPQFWDQAYHQDKQSCEKDNRDMSKRTYEKERARKEVPGAAFQQRLIIAKLGIKEAVSIHTRTCFTCRVFTQQKASTIRERKIVEAINPMWAVTGELHHRKVMFFFSLKVYAMMKESTRDENEAEKRLGISHFLWYTFFSSYKKRMAMEFALPVRIGETAMVANNS
jgi:hypothetical protein